MQVSIEAESTEQKPQEERRPNRFEAAAAVALRNIWDWLAVRGDYRPPGVTAEYAIATNWLVRLGIIILVAGIGFFLKYSIEKDLIPPIGRVSLSMITGIIMIVGGIRILGGKYQLLGQGLIGGGLATLYFSVFAAVNFHGLITFFPAFVLMAVITLGAGWLAVRLNSLLIAVLGLLGGYGTPLMLKAAAVSFPGQFTYLLLLGAGTLGVSWKKDWRLLNYLSFIGTYGLVAQTLHQHYTVAHFWQVMPFLTAFFVLFTTMTFLYNVINGKTSTMLELIELGLNAAIFFVIGSGLIREAYNREWVAALTLGIGVYCIAHIYWFLLRRNQDRGLLLSFIGIAAFFVTLTMPIIMSDSWITVSWAIQALIMLWIANKLNSEFLRSAAFLLYAVVLWRFCFVDLQRQYFRVPSPHDMLAGDYVKSLLERLIVFGVPIGSVAAAYRLIQQPGQVVGVAVDRTNDIKRWIEGNVLAKIIVIAGVVLLFLYLHLELNRTCMYLFDPLRLPVLTLLWVALAGLALIQCMKSESAGMCALVAILAGVVIGKMWFVDLASWKLDDHFVYGGAYSVLDGAMRLLDFGAIIAFLAAAWRLLGRSVQTKATAVWMGNIAIVLLFVFFTFELNTFLGHFVEDLQPGGISILWSVFALSFLVAGILKDIRQYRYLGLGLFALVALKVTFVDLKDLSQIYRIVAFIALGLLVLAGSFAYLTFRQKFGTET